MTLLALPATASASYPGANGRIAFTRNGDIYTVRPDGSGVRRLTFTATATADGLNAWPAWSPDGRLIAYASRVSGSWDVWLMSADGSGKRRITTSAANETEPTWSPDGRWLAFSSDRYADELGPKASIFKLRSSKPYGTAIRLTRPGPDPDTGLNQQDSSPAWSPLGNAIMFTRETPYGGEPSGVRLYTVPASGGAATEIETGFGDAWLGDWAPKGRAIAWTSDADSPSQYYEPPIDIWQRTAAGVLRRVTPAENLSTYDPAWSPTGTRVAYASLDQHEVDARIWTIRADGSDPQLVARNASQPSWQPLVG